MQFYTLHNNIFNVLLYFYVGFMKEKNSNRVLITKYSPLLLSVQCSKNFITHISLSQNKVLSTYKVYFVKGFPILLKVNV